MADSKITALTALTGANLATNDVFPMVDISDTTMDATGTNKKMTASEVGIGLGALIALTTSSNRPTSSVTMTTAGTFYDGASLTPAAGVYLLVGSISLTPATNAARTFSVKLWDGTTAFAQAEYTVPGTAAAGSITLMLADIQTLTGSQTVKISGTSTVNSDVIRATSWKGNYLHAIKIG